MGICKKGSKDCHTVEQPANVLCFDCEYKKQCYRKYYIKKYGKLKGKKIFEEIYG